MSIEAVADLVQHLRTEPGGASASTDQTRAKLTRLAAEFESMLMLQMLKEMRKSGSWDDEDTHKDGLGSQTMLETVDVELANHLSKAQGFGLAKQMLTALSAMAGTGEPATGVVEHALNPGSIAHALNPSPAAHMLKPSAIVAVSRSAPVLEASPAHDEGARGDSLEMPEGTVTSGFGWRRDPLDGAAKFHQGIDIRAAYGQDVQTAGAGRVISAGTQGGYGQTVVIEHAGGIRTRYAHLSMGLVAVGDEVTAGQVVGRAGRSGRTTGTHLHFEVMTASGKRIDPAEISRFKVEGLLADWTVGPIPMQETRTHDDTN